MKNAKQQQPKTNIYLFIKKTVHLYITKIQSLATVTMKRPADDEEQDGASGSSAKRILPEDQVRPPLSRGDSLPAVPFVPERPPNFKDKHPIRAPSFDTATFKAGSKWTFFASNYYYFVHSLLW